MRCRKATIALAGLVALAMLMPAAAAADREPVVTGFSVSNHVFAATGDASASRDGVERGTRFEYSTSEPSQLEISIQRRIDFGSGTAHTFTEIASLGPDGWTFSGSLRFSGRLHGRALRPGRYRARVVATDPAGNRSAPRRVAFRIVSG
jgi:hypothetical protein